MVDKDCQTENVANMLRNRTVTLSAFGANSPENEIEIVYNNIFSNSIQNKRINCFHSISTPKKKTGKPSRVIHIRNIPNESGEAEVIQLGVPFGRVTNVLVLKGKNQAFLEMADEVSAAAMVACFNNSPPQVRGRTVYVQFSNHRELKTDQSHSVAVSIRNQNHCFISLDFHLVLSLEL